MRTLASLDMEESWDSSLRLQQQAPLFAPKLNNTQTPPLYPLDLHAELHASEFVHAPGRHGTICPVFVHNQIDRRLAKIKLNLCSSLWSSLICVVIIHIAAFVEINLNDDYFHVSISRHVCISCFYSLSIYKHYSCT